MTVAILMCESLILTTGFRILIRNFIPHTLQGGGGILANHVAYLYFPMFLSPNSPSEVSQPPRTTWIVSTQKCFSVFFLNAICSSSEEKKTLVIGFSLSHCSCQSFIIKKKNQKIPLGEELFLKDPRGRTLKVSQRSCLDGLSEQSVGCSQPLYKGQENSSSTQLQVTSEQRFQGRSMADLHYIRATFQLHNLLENLI